ncbi:MAG TPA: uroporphyrinogen-III synthase, partial [Candidatus Limnocylindrales bacterium]|nr:uroporphyrinogen-III synthase [Candidatus Limnocylindrales bacterium]
VVVTSSNAAAVLAQALQARRDGATAASPGPRIAAVGRATTRTLLASGLPVAFRPAKATARTLAQTLPLEPGARILAPRSDVADDGLIEILQGRGATVDAVIAYRTHLAPAASRASLAAALDNRPRAAVFTSGSTVRGLLELAETIARRNDLLAIPAVCIGQPTAEEARRQGFEVVATSERQAVGAIADATAGYFRLQEVPT